MLANCAVIPVSGGFSTTFMYCFFPLPELSAIHPSCVVQAFTNGALGPARGGALSALGLRGAAGAVAPGGQPGGNSAQQLLVLQQQAAQQQAAAQRQQQQQQLQQQQQQAVAQFGLGEKGEGGRWGFMERGGS